MCFQVEKAEAQRFTVAPTLMFKLRITNGAPGEVIHSVALRCQIQLEVDPPQYDGGGDKQNRAIYSASANAGPDASQPAMDPCQRGRSAFQDTIVVDLPVPCTFDFNVAATKYFHGLGDGDVPLSFLFSGTVFYADSTGALQVAPIPWDREARFRLPIRSWHDMMDIYYPNSAWLCLRRDVFERLYQYKVQNGIPTWEQALEKILPAFEEAIKR